MDPRDLEAQYPRRRSNYGPIGPPDSYRRALALYGPAAARAAVDVAGQAMQSSYVAPPAAAAVFKSLLDYWKQKKRKATSITRPTKRPRLTTVVRRRDALGGLTRGHLSKMRGKYKTSRRGGKRRRLRKRTKKYKKKRYVNKTKSSFAYNVQKALQAPHFVQRAAGIHIKVEKSRGTLAFLCGAASGTTPFSTTQTWADSAVSWKDPQIYGNLLSVTGAQDSTTDFHIANMRLAWRLKNQSDTCIWFRKWILKPRRDYLASANTGHGTGPDAPTFIANALLHDSMYTAEKADKVYGMMWEPYQSSTLCSYFKISGGKTYCVKAGMDWAYAMKQKKEWLIPATRSSRTFFKEQRIIMLQIFGDLAHNPDAVGDVGTTTADIDAICEWSCNFYRTANTKHTPTTGTVLASGAQETVVDVDMEEKAQ